MKDYKEYNHEEIETIANEFENGVIIPENMKLWYEYKRAVKTYISNGAFWENHENQDSEIVQKIVADIKDARTELAWIRSIKTFDLHKVCEYIDKAYNHYDGRNSRTLTNVMANRVLDGCTKQEEQMVRELLEESEYLDTINTVRKLTRPIDERKGKWSYAFNRPTEYYPMNDRPVDATILYNHREHYVYIKDTNVATWGESFWISVDCQNTLESLPVIKAFKEFDFEVGKFYKIQCTDEIHFGKNKKKYIMDITEIDEATFMEKGFIAFATRF